MMAELAADQTNDLGSVRRASGISIEQISKETKIDARFLRAIENGRLSELPGGIYTVSYVRQYARAVGVDPSNICPSTLAELANTDTARLRYR